MIRKAATTCALLLLFSAFGARAAIVQTYNAKAAFLLNVPILSGNIITIGPAPAPNIDLNGSALSASAGLLTVTAVVGNLFGNSVDLTTEIALDTLELDFSQPLSAVGLTVLITDDAFSAVAGSLLVSAVGSGTETVPVTAAGGSFIGLVSDTNFTRILVSILSSDPDVTSAPFATLTDAVLPELAIPAPGLGVFFLPALLLGWRRSSGMGSVRTKWRAAFAPSR
jgi:hypothetical protein